MYEIFKAKKYDGNFFNEKNQFNLTLLFTQLTFVHYVFEKIYG